MNPKLPSETVNPEEADMRQRILGLMEDRAVAALHEALLSYCAEFPESAWGWLISVPALLDLGLYKEAKDAWRRARDLSDDDNDTAAMLCYWACTIDKERGKLKGAQQWIEQAIELAPGQGSYWVTFGDILARRGKQDEAANAHQSAIKANTGDVDEAHYNLALLLRSQRRYQDSMAQVDQALTIDPDYAAAHALRLDLERVLQAGGSEAS